MSLTATFAPKLACIYQKWTNTSPHAQYTAAWLTRCACVRANVNRSRCESTARIRWTMNECVWFGTARKKTFCFFRQKPFFAQSKNLSSLISVRMLWFMREIVEIRLFGFDDAHCRYDMMSWIKTLIEQHSQYKFSIKILSRHNLCSHWDNIAIYYKRHQFLWSTKPIE